jgi:hypothetical protein
LTTPFESKFEVVSIPKRNTKAGKKLSAKKRGKKIKLYDDKEIDALLRIYGDNIQVYQ